MEAAKASATAASSSVETAAEGKSDKPTAAGTTTRRRTKLVKVEQGIIDRLLARPKSGERCSCCFVPRGGTFFDALAGVIDDPELLKEVEMRRARYHEAVATFNKTYPMIADILKQYKEKGYAIVEVDDQEAD